MTKKTDELILKMIFGFAFISAIDSILYLISHSISFAVISLEFSLTAANISISVLTFVLYMLTIYLVIKFINSQEISSDNLFQKIPKPVIWISFLIAISVRPLTNKLSGLFAEHFTLSESANYLPTTDYLSIYGWTIAMVGISRWTALIILTIIFWKGQTGRSTNN